MKKGGFKNLSVRIKLVVSHALIAFLALLVALLGILSIQYSTNRMLAIQTGPMVAAEAIGDLKYATADLQRVFNGMMIGVMTNSGQNMQSADTDALSASLSSSMDENIALMGGAMMDLYTGLIDYPEAAAKIEEIGALIEISGAQRQEVMAAFGTGDINQINAVYQTGYRATLLQIQAAVNELSTFVDAISDQNYQDTETTNTIMLIMMVSMIVICLILGFLLAHVVSNSIRRPIEQLMNASKQMQEGNLSVADTITYQSRDEVGVLADSMRDTLHFLHAYVAEISETLRAVADGDLTKRNSDITDFRGDFAAFKDSLVYILDKLNQTLSDIHMAADQVNSGADQVASGAQALSQGATEQASAVEELAATISEVNGMIQKTKEVAAVARESAAKDGARANDTDNQIHQMLAAMDAISRSSDEIGKIIKTIEDIAFQTNILALNAAVEAARAGSAGKGFAVVADEVRNLAAKSAEASQNTASLIEESKDAVVKGTKLAHITAEILGGIAGGAQEAAGVVAGFATSSEQQAESMQYISIGIDQISAVVQTNSATAEESAAASEELSSQAAVLKELLDQFRLRDM